MIEVEINQKSFALGETVHLMVRTDNTNCDKDMEPVVIKLRSIAKYSAKISPFGMVINKSDEMKVDIF